jgi:uncharacterized protein DUF6918
MYTTLPDVLDANGAQQQIARDCVALVDQEISAKSGISAAALKLAYAAVTTFAPGYYLTTVEKLVPKMLRQLQPFWADFHAGEGGQFGEYLASRGQDVSEALLAVTDDLAQGSPRGAIIKAYNAVRDGARGHIEAALPSVGALVEKYAG